MEDGTWNKAILWLHHMHHGSIVFWPHLIFSYLCSVNMGFITSHWGCGLASGRPSSALLSSLWTGQPLWGQVRHDEVRSLRTRSRSGWRTLYRKSGLCMCSQKWNCMASFPIPTVMYLWAISQIYEYGNWETEHYNSVLEITRSCSFISVNT